VARVPAGGIVEVYATVVVRDCLRVTAGSVVAHACAAGGRSYARAFMKELVERASARGVKVECGSCHTDEQTFTLRRTARQDLERLLALVHG
jgi:leucyl aminopeptidase (aminopeptidase T)